MTAEPESSQARDDLLYSCAELFYVQGITKRAIAQRLHVSPTHVKRLLDEAESKGIVEIEVKLAGRFRRLEKALEREWGLRFVRVVETAKTYDELKGTLGRAAADFFEEYIERRSRVQVGIGGGSTLLRMVESLEQKPRHVDIYPLSMFSRGPLVEFISSPFNVVHLLVKSRPTAAGYVVGVPPLPSKPEHARNFSSWLLERFPEVREVYEGSLTVELAFVGLGAFVPSTDLFSEFGKLGYTFEYMQKHGAVGGINYNFFDLRGQQLGKGILTVSIADLRSMSMDPSRTVTLVAGGSHKREAVRLAVSTAMVNALITDEDMARHLLTSRA